MLFERLSFVVTAGMRVGLVVPDGSGKSSLAAHAPRRIGSRWVEKFGAPTGLRVVYFDQSRQLDMSMPLRRALAPEGDSVVYQDRVIQVAS